MSEKPPMNAFAPSDSGLASIAPVPLMKRNSVQRCLTVFLFLQGWAVIGVAVVALTGLVTKDIAHRAPEANLTALESFARFARSYWFTAPFFLWPPLSLMIWLTLKRIGIRPTRWYLLAIGLGASPLLLGISWLAFRKLVYP